MGRNWAHGKASPTPAHSSPAHQNPSYISTPFPLPPPSPGPRRLLPLPQPPPPPSLLLLPTSAASLPALPSLPSKPRRRHWHMDTGASSRPDGGIYGGLLYPGGGASTSSSLRWHGLELPPRCSLKLPPRRGHELPPQRCLELPPWCAEIRNELRSLHRRSGDGPAARHAEIQRRRPGARWRSSGDGRGAAVVAAGGGRSWQRGDGQGRSGGSPAAMARGAAAEV